MKLKLFGAKDLRMGQIQYEIFLSTYGSSFTIKIENVEGNQTHNFSQKHGTSLKIRMIKFAFFSASAF